MNYQKYGIKRLVGGSEKRIFKYFGKMFSSERYEWKLGLLSTPLSNITSREILNIRSVACVSHQLHC